MGHYFRGRKRERAQADKAAETSRIERFDQGYAQALARLDDELRDCPDLVERPFTLAGGEHATLFHFDGLVNQDLLERDLLPALLAIPGERLAEPRDVIPVATIKIQETIEQALESLCSGFVLLAAEGLPHALAFEFKGWERRAVEEPQVERNIRGPHEGFSENLRVNTSLIRKKVRTPQLKIRELTLGRRSHTAVALVYLEGVANPELLARIEERLHRIDYDAIQASGCLEQLITENPLSPFPQTQATERPDKAVGNLLEGRILVIVDGTPAVLMAPVDFFQFFQAFDDYSTNWIVSSVLRFLRIAAVFLAIFLPSFYIAVLTFHYEALPWTLLVSLVQTRSKVPVPPIVEAFLMEFVIELIREAAIRLPSYIGQVIGIVGGLVIGQAVVSAGIVSNLMIIIVGVTAIASFVIPSYEMGLAMRLIRFPVMIVSSIFGITGLLACGTILLTHLLSLESLGQPYFAPLAPLQPGNLKDAFIRAPFTMQGPRPRFVRPADSYRGKGREDG